MVLRVFGRDEAHLGEMLKAIQEHGVVPLHPEDAVRIRRAYEEPGPDDGRRVLVDRVWPRGRTRDELRLDAWERELAPSSDLRRRFRP